MSERSEFRGLTGGGMYPGADADLTAPLEGAATALRQRVLAQLRRRERQHGVGGPLGDRFVAAETPVGRVYVAYNVRGYALVSRLPDDDAFVRAFQARFGRTPDPDPHPPRAVRRLVERGLLIPAAEARHLPVDYGDLGAFSREVLEMTRRIPRGSVRPYAWVAKELGRPRAVRAVANALAHNPVPLLVPCHRVVRSDWTLGGYSMGGGAVKEALLATEETHLGSLEAMRARHAALQGSDTTRIFCLPTCVSERNLTEGHRVFFASAREALARGYRPCKLCRPV